jgi:hypothetical protein
MGSLPFAFSWWGILLQAFAIIHFNWPPRHLLAVDYPHRRVAQALVYIAVEATLTLVCCASLQSLPAASVSASWSAILDNPSAETTKNL